MSSSDSPMARCAQCAAQLSLPQAGLGRDDYAVCSAACRTLWEVEHELDGWSIEEVGPLALDHKPPGRYIGVFAEGTSRMTAVWCYRVMALRSEFFARWLAVEDIPR